MAKSCDFEVADSSCRFCGIGNFLGRICHFLENRLFLSTLCTLKIRGISHNSKKLAKFQVEIVNRNWSLQNRHFKPSKLYFEVIQTKKFLRNSNHEPIPTPSQCKYWSSIHHKLKGFGLGPSIGARRHGIPRKNACF